MTPGNAEQDTGHPRHGGMFWGTIFVSLPYLVLVLVVGGWALAMPAVEPTLDSADQGQHIDPDQAFFSSKKGVLFALGVSVPFVTLAIALAWLIVLGLGLTRAAHWRPITRGALGAGLCWVIAASTLMIWSV